MPEIQSNLALALHLCRNTADALAEDAQEGRVNIEACKLFIEGTESLLEYLRAKVVGKTKRIESGGSKCE